MENNFDQMILPLGKTQLPGRVAALAVYDALVEMAQRCECPIEEMTLRREAYDLVIALRTDEIGANEENIQSACAALSQASILRVYGYDDETFWLEITMPAVFVSDDFDAAKPEVSFVGEKREQPDATPQLPEWFAGVMQAVRAEKDQLVFEDFVVDKQKFFALVDIYGAFKRMSDEAIGEFVFKQPKAPTNEHGACYLIAEKLTIRKADIDVLFPLIAQASSFSVSLCTDDSARLGVEVSYVYERRE